MRKLLLIFTFSFISWACGDDNTEDIIPAINLDTGSDKIYFENKICKCPQAKDGDSAIINGTSYTVVNNSSIKDQIAAGNIKLCTTLVTDMSGGFTGSLTNFFNNNSFDSDISFWDVSNVINMDGMFFGAVSFNRDISGWNVSKVTNMGSMFKDASLFNQNIGNWNTSNVTKMLDFFRNASAFNQDIGKWNTSNVTSMQGIFQDASTFNQNLSNWCVTNILLEPDNFAINSALSTDNKPAWGTCPP